MGAKEVLYLAAFDDRVKAAVFSEGGIAFDSTNWDAPWYLGKGIHAEDFSLNHHQLLALFNHGEGHSIPEVAHTRAIEWLQWGLS